MNKRNRPIWDGSFYFKVVLFVDGVLLGQGDDSLLSGGLVAFEVTGDHTHDAGDLLHVLFLQAAGGGSGSADADTGSDERLLGVVGDGVLVDGDEALVKEREVFFLTRMSSEKTI